MAQGAACVVPVPPNERDVAFAALHALAGFAHELATPTSAAKGADERMRTLFARATAGALRSVVGALDDQTLAAACWFAELGGAEVASARTSRIGREEAVLAGLAARPRALMDGARLAMRVAPEAVAGASAESMHHSV